jgi:hypothetical protein
MPQTKHNVSLDDLYAMLQDINRRLITVEASAKPSVPKSVESSKGGASAEWQETLAVLKRTQGAWAANPWENAVEDIRAMREEWGHRDFWNPDPAKQHRD